MAFGVPTWTRTFGLLLFFFRVPGSCWGLVSAKHETLHWVSKGFRLPPVNEVSVSNASVGLQTATEPSHFRLDSNVVETFNITSAADDHIAQLDSIEQSESFSEQARIAARLSSFERILSRAQALQHCDKPFVVSLGSSSYREIKAGTVGCGSTDCDYTCDFQIDRDGRADFVVIPTYGHLPAHPKLPS